MHNDKIGGPRSVGELMQILYDRIEANGGVVVGEDFVFRFTPYGTHVWPRAEYDKMMEEKK